MSEGPASRPSQRYAGRAAVAGVSAVVVNHDGGEQVLRCLRHLEAQQPPLDEVIVVDSGSTDGSPDAIRQNFPTVRLVALDDNLGPSVARNRGLREARNRHVLLVDDDVYLAPETSRLLMERFATACAAVVVPRLLLLPESDLIQLDGADVHFVGTMVLRNARAKAADTPMASGPTGGFSTSCVLCDRDVVLDAGGIDEAFFIYLEDMELGLRLRSFGHRLVLEPAAVAWHDRGAGTPGLSYRDQGEYPRRRAFLTMRNRLQVIILHYRLGTILVLAPALALYELASLALAIRRGWFGAWLRAWRWQVDHRRDLAARRRTIQQSRQLDDGRLLTGGRVPLAEGILRSAPERFAVDALNRILDGYWRIVRRLLGWRPEADGPSSNHERSVREPACDGSARPAVCRQRTD